MTFTPPKPWAPDRFRSVVTSLEDKTIINLEAISWCTTHDNEAVHEQGTGCYQAIAIGNWSDSVISSGGPDHKWWKKDV